MINPVNEGAARVWEDARRLGYPDRIYLPYKLKASTYVLAPNCIFPIDPPADLGPGWWKVNIDPETLKVTFELSEPTEAIKEFSAIRLTWRYE